MREEKYVIIYPAYLNAKISRKKGRRVPREYTVKNPTVNEIFRAARKLRLSPVVEAGKSYPRNWFYEKGRIKVVKVKSKLNTLKMIGAALKKIKEGD